MNTSDKYFKLMALLFGGFFGFISLIVLLFFILKLCSITLFFIPGFDRFFQFVVVIIPYTIFFGGYYYLKKQIHLSKSKRASIIAMTLLIIGSFSCFLTLILATLKLFGVHKSFLLTYEDNSQYGWILQVVILFFTALTIASGDGKEEDWMQKHAEEIITEEKK